MDPVCINGRQGHTMTRPSTSGRQSSTDEWTGYQWNISLDEVFDCQTAPECCQKCYYRNKGMSKTKKFAISILFITVSIILAALVVRYSLGPNELILGAGNQRPITYEDSNFSPLLCSKYSLTNVNMVQNPVAIAGPSTSATSSLTSSSSAGSISVNDIAASAPRFDAYLLLDLPYRNYITNTFEKLEHLHFPDPSYFNYWALYLDSGSSVVMTVCPKWNTQVYLRVVEGKKVLDHILHNREVSGEITHTFMPCDTSRISGIYHYNVINSQPDDYAFIFTISETINLQIVNFSTPVSFSISLKELVFDQWAVYASCKDLTRCTLPVPNKAVAVMLEMNQTTTLWPMTIRAECIPAIEMYFAFFLGVPVGFTLFLLMCGGVLYLCQTSVMRDVENADRLRTTTSRNYQSPSYSSTCLSTGNPNCGTMSRSTTSRRAFRTATSQRSPLVDHDVLTAMTGASSRQRDLPPTYEEIAHVSSPVSGDAPVLDSTQEQDHDSPPPYDSVVI